MHEAILKLRARVENPGDFVRTLFSEEEEER